MQLKVNMIKHRIGFEPGSSGIGSDRAVNCATHTAPALIFFIWKYSANQFSATFNVLCYFLFGLTKWKTLWARDKKRRKEVDFDWKRHLRPSHLIQFSFLHFKSNWIWIVCDWNVVLIPTKYFTFQHIKLVLILGNKEDLGENQLWIKFCLVNSPKYCTKSTYFGRYMKCRCRCSLSTYLAMTTSQSSSGWSFFWFHLIRLSKHKKIPKIFVQIFVNRLETRSDPFWRLKRMMARSNWLDLLWRDFWQD